MKIRLESRLETGQCSRKTTATYVSLSTVILGIIGTTTQGPVKQKFFAEKLPAAKAIAKAIVIWVGPLLSVLILRQARGDILIICQGKAMIPATTSLASLKLRSALYLLQMCGLPCRIRQHQGAGRWLQVAASSVSSAIV